ncbi:hypothetical protein IAQ61_006989 [Plenodomus lingam]|uniref:uncharacterized protein n=1 Tax=Leptosphaeria maculans TaxID=5022 RepID=UPI0033241F8B|nr:hypothetical protein IAQ61_006989 [Plenodomus lingam]
MLIGLCGGICAGKSSIAEYLVDEHNFTRIHLARTAATPELETSASSTHVPSPEPNPPDNDHSQQQHIFPNVDALVDFVTLRWRDRWVTTDIWDDKTVDLLLRRPFFLLISVDAPLTLRFHRLKAKHTHQHLPAPSLETFVTSNDTHLFAPGTGRGALFQRAHLKLVNSTPDLPSLRNALRALDLTHEARLRPSWDQYFMQLADLAAHRSNCMKRRVGCCIVREKRVISTGYNGTPRGMTNCNQGGCPRCNTATPGPHTLSTCLCLHAEENALLEAGRDRIAANAILYCNTCPCLTCSVKIVQVGIGEVVYHHGYSVDEQTAQVLAQGGVRLRQFTPPAGGVVDLAFVGEGGVGG